MDLRTRPQLVPKQLLTTQTVPAFGGGLVRSQSGIAVSVAIGVFAVLALQQSLEVIVAAADVARLIHGVIQLFSWNHLSDLHHAFALRNLTVRSTAVGALGCEFAAFHDAGKTE